MKDQNVSPKAKFRVPSRRTVISAALAALILCVGMNAYHYSLEGARGLYVWHPLLILKMLLYMGLLPLSTAIIGLPLEKLAQKGPMKAMRWLSLVSSVLVGLISVFLLAFLIVVPRTGHIETARLTLINPAKGIIAREDSMPALSRTGSASTTANIAVPATELPLLRLAFSSDPHWGADTANITARADILTSVARSAPDAFFMLGDTVESGNSAVQWILALSDLEALIPNVPVRPLLGNHDALFGGQYLYAKAFWQPSFKSDSGSPYYWRIDAGGATIVAVDLPWGTENFGTRQRTWLEKTLSGADPQKPLIVLSHSYFYASGYDDPVSGSPWYD
ncbi:MAG: metallophosphoesterase, partial [Rectinema sp.]|nr:metallophosphoesterase [Rectinema sp.]